MNPFSQITRFVLSGCFFLQLLSCTSPVKEKNDSLYSRHLQRKVELAVVSTPMPDDHADMNLFILLTGEDNGKWSLKKVLDSLQEAKAIEPTLIVEVKGKPDEEFGLSEMSENGLPGKRAALFNKFIVNELYPYIKKKATVRKFHAITIAGAGKAGISAFDLAWHDDEKFSRVAIFSGDWNAWKRDPADSTAVLEYLSQTRKRPKLDYWFYTGEKPDTVISRLTGLIKTKLLSKSFISDSDIQLLTEPLGTNDMDAWNTQLANCLVWAFGKK